MAKDKDAPYPPDYMHGYWIIPLGWNEGILLPIEAAANVMTNLTRGTRVKLQQISGVAGQAHIIHPSGEPIDHNIKYIGMRDQVEMAIDNAQAQAYMDAISATLALQNPVSSDQPPLPFTYQEWARKESEH